MSKGTRDRRVRLWRKNPHCFWCGQKTLLVFQNPMPPDGATLDHIRSRFIPNRVQQQHRPWWPGITVLACSQCNNERGSMEQAVLAVLRPEVLHDKSNSPPASQELLKVQSRLCARVLAYIREHGERAFSLRGAPKILGAAKRLQREYDKKKKSRKESMMSKAFEQRNNHRLMNTTLTQSLNIPQADVGTKPIESARVRR